MTTDNHYLQKRLETKVRPKTEQAEEAQTAIVPVSLLQKLQQVNAEGTLTIQVDDSSIFERCTDIANGRRFADLAKEQLLWVPEWNSWLQYNSGIWKKDAKLLPAQIARKISKLVFQEAARSNDDDEESLLAKWGLASSKIDRMRAAIDLGKSEPGLYATPAEFDSDPWLLNCSNGVLNLQSGTLRPHSPSYRLTKQAPVAFDPEAKACRWEQFLQEVFLNDSELIAYLQRVCGYALTGFVNEQVYWVFWGAGANGKSVFAEVIRLVAGDYYERADPSLFIQNPKGAKAGEASPHIAGLKGARLVVASETPPNAKLAETVLKEITGGDALVGRFLYGNPFTFTPSHKLILMTNHRPRVSQDKAVWRRTRLVPFLATFPPEKQDHDLLSKLRNELPGILAWIVKGAQAWASQGLQEPTSVTLATAQYHDAEDVVGRFIADRCTLVADSLTPFADLYKEFESWCKDNGEPEYGGKRFSDELESRGVSARKGSKGIRLRVGIKIRSSTRKGGIAELSRSIDRAPRDANKYLVPLLAKVEKLTVAEVVDQLEAKLSTDRINAALAELEDLELIFRDDQQQGIIYISKSLKAR